MNTSIQQLQLLQLADSACPIGAVAHSWGLETLAVDEMLTVDRLEAFLHDHLCETGLLEAVFATAGHRIGQEVRLNQVEWLALNTQLSARKPAREVRAASATMGRRLLQLAHDLHGDPRMEQALRNGQQERVDLHHSTVFGLVGGMLGWDERATIAAYLHQAAAGLVSACQRLLPLGQRKASQIVWRLKPTIDAVTQLSARSTVDNVTSFTPLLDVGAMRHPGIPTRLFIS